MLETDLRFLRGEEPVHIQLKEEMKDRILGIHGPSGSGKTSFLNILCGLRVPDRGRILFDGELLFDSGAAVNLPPHKRRIGAVFQDYRLFPHMTVEQNLKYGYGKNRRTPAPADVIEQLELSPLLHRKPARLSGGEKQRVALGRSILALPRLLLLDEPFSAMDARLAENSARWVRELCRELGMPVILVSHSRQELLHTADRYLDFTGNEISCPGSCIGITA